MFLLICGLRSGTTTTEYSKRQQPPTLARWTMPCWIVFARKSHRGHQRFIDNRMNNPSVWDEGVACWLVGCFVTAPRSNHKFSLKRFCRSPILVLQPDSPLTTSCARTNSYDSHTPRVLGCDHPIATGILLESHSHKPFAVLGCHKTSPAILSHTKFNK